MFTAFIYTYFQVTFIRTKILYHNPNRQLNRQPASESASGRKLTFEPIEHLFWPKVFF